MSTKRRSCSPPEWMRGCVLWKANGHTIRTRCEPKSRCGLQSHHLQSGLERSCGRDRGVRRSRRSREPRSAGGRPGEPSRVTVGNATTRKSHACATRRAALGSESVSHHLSDRRDRAGGKYPCGSGMVHENRDRSDWTDPVRLTFPSCRRRLFPPRAESGAFGTHWCRLETSFRGEGRKLPGCPVLAPRRSTRPQPRSTASTAQGWHSDVSPIRLPPLSRP